MFKRNLVSASAAALVLFCASQASAADLYEPALPDLSAVMSMYAGGSFLDQSGPGDECSSGENCGQFDDNTWLAGGNARVAGQSWQLELAGSVLGDTDKECDGCSAEYQGSTYFALAGHWLGRGETGTWGAFGGFAHVSHQDSDSTSGNLFGGLEYAHFSGNSTLFGQVGGTVAVSGETTDTWEQGIFARLGWRYFMSPTSKFEVDGMVGWGEFDSSDDGVTAAWGAEFENQFSGPFSGFVAYRGHYVEDSDNNPCCSEDQEVVSHSIMVGFRIAVNSEDLLQRDRTGAGTFDIPDLHRALAWPNDLN